MSEGGALGVRAGVARERESRERDGEKQTEERGRSGKGALLVTAA